MIIGISSTGTDQPTARILPARGNLVTYDVTVVPEGSGIRLPDSVQVPSITFLRNSGENSLQVYPVVGGTIDGQPIYTLGVSSSVVMWSLSPIDWVTLSTSAIVFLPPAFTSFTIPGQSTALEIGDEFPSGSYTFTWSTSNSSNVAVNSVGITDTTAGSPIASGLANDGTEDITLSSIVNTVPAAQVWTIHATNTQSATLSRTFSIGWYYRVHAGNASAATLDSAGVLALELDPFKSVPQGDYVITSGFNYKFIAYPEAMGDIIQIVDPSVGFPIAMATADDDAAYSNVMAEGLSYALVSVINTFGVDVTYRVLRTQNPIGGALTMRVF